jgi:carbonic anhydrase
MDRLKPAEKPSGTDSVVITRMDYRYHETIKDLLDTKHGVDIDQVDQLSIGGSSKGVTNGSLNGSIKIAYEKHGARNAYLFDHTDCGGFGGLETFNNDEQKEAGAHFEEQDRATRALKELFPDLVVVTYVIGLEGEPLSRET